MKLEQVQQAVKGVPVMEPAQGRAIYEHVLEAEPVEILELGTSRGVSAAYMAAALDELGRGKITTLDRAQLVVDPPPEEQAFAKVPELLRYVRFERPPDSSYVWWLAREVEARSDAHGNCEPAYDFCYLDGAHDYTIDGLAVYLVEKLLRPQSWLLLDDLNWSYAVSGLDFGDRFSEDEMQAAHMRLVFDTIVRQHPSFTEFRDQDGSWGWARKAPGEPRRYTLETSQSASALIIDRMKRISVAARGRMRR
jgi:predicted O-methyltransferase YrrM